MDRIWIKSFQRKQYFHCPFSCVSICNFSCKLLLIGWCFGIDDCVTLLNFVINLSSSLQYRLTKSGTTKFVSCHSPCNLREIPLWFLGCSIHPIACDLHSSTTHINKLHDTRDNQVARYKLSSFNVATIITQPHRNPTLCETTRPQSSSSQW